MKLIEVSIILLWIMMAGISVAVYAVSRYVGEFLKAQKEAVVPVESGPSIGSTARHIISSFPDATDKHSAKVCLFLSTSCRGCSELALRMSEMSNHLDTGKILAYVESSDSEHYIFSILKKLGISFREFEPGTFSRDWQISQVPTVMVVDEGERISGVYYGTIEALQKYAFLSKSLGA
jgi:hypothetical protein